MYSSQGCKILKQHFEYVIRKIIFSNHSQDIRDNFMKTFIKNPRFFFTASFCRHLNKFSISTFTPKYELKEYFSLNSIKKQYFQTILGNRVIGESIYGIKPGFCVLKNRKLSIPHPQKIFAIHSISKKAFLQIRILIKSCTHLNQGMHSWNKIFNYQKDSGIVEIAFGILANKILNIRTSNYI